MTIAVIAVVVVAVPALLVLALWIVMRNPELERRARLAERRADRQEELLTTLASRMLDSADVDPAVSDLLSMIEAGLGDLRMRAIRSSKGA